MFSTQKFKQVPVQRALPDPEASSASYSYRNSLITSECTFFRWNCNEKQLSITALLAWMDSLPETIYWIPSCKQGLVFSVFSWGYSGGVCGILLLLCSLCVDCLLRIQLPEFAVLPFSQNLPSVYQPFAVWFVGCKVITSCSHAPRKRKRSLTPPQPSPTLTPSPPRHHFFEGSPNKQAYKEKIKGTWKLVYHLKSLANHCQTELDLNSLNRFQLCQKRH